MIIIYGPTELIVPNTSVPIDWLDFSGVMGRMHAFDLDFELLGVLVEGVLSFELASTYAGERVRGSFEAAVMQPP